MKRDEQNADENVFRRGEYPAGSVACAESTGELKHGHRNRWFIMFTNVQIDAGFVVSAFVPMVVVLATTENHLRAAWRICLALGVIPPLSLLYLRIKLQEPEEFKRESLKDTRTPWWLVIKYVPCFRSLISFKVLALSALLSYTCPFFTATAPSCLIIKLNMLQVLLVPPHHRLSHLVHLRLLLLLLQHLLLILARHHPWRQRATLEVLWLEHHHQPVLHSRRHHRRLPVGLDRAETDVGDRRHSTGSRGVLDVWSVSDAEHAGSRRRLCGHLRYFLDVGRDWSW